MTQNRKVDAIGELIAYGTPIIGLVLGLVIAEYISNATGMSRRVTGTFGLMFAAAFTLAVVYLGIRIHRWRAEDE